ncbi:hypothetical protein AVEN_266113-1 [Araneus ventricosus]|uniref:DUF19 domain-containing protein n=1 Tax=Araneus ventricosus TaxID=182803 RepID=A0A4Y2KXJ1_ARAVE|nr:hypothetical protein AVEN_266113-1 [Araneus ventricosus]
MIFCLILLYLFVQANLSAVGNAIPMITDFQYCNLNDGAMLQLPLNEPDFRFYCWRLLDYYKCVDKYKEYYPKNKKMHVPRVLSNAKRFMKNKLCKMNTVQKRYLKHMKCFKNAMNSYGSCLESAQGAVLEYYEKKNFMEPLWMIVTRRCLEESIRLTCFTSIIESRCGSDASALYSEILEETKFLLSMCPQHRFIYARDRTNFVSDTSSFKKSELCNRGSCSAHF